MNKSYFTLSKATLIFAAFIIISASFMRQAAGFFQSLLGEKSVVIFLGALISAACLWLLTYSVIKGFHPVKTAAFLFVLILGAMYCASIEIPLERAHVLEYGILGYLAIKGLSATNKTSSEILPACIFCLIIGIADESLQAVLPYRVFDMRDIVFNVVGAFWGMSLFILR